MNRTLTQRLHPDYLRVSRISAWITLAILLLATGVYFALASWNGWTYVPGWVALGVLAVLSVLFIWIVPTVLYRHFAFEVFEEELEIESGLIFISNVLVPMTRVQHVELETGPLMRKFGLAEVTVVTAATKHRIKGLAKADAERLKRRIGVLAKVVDADE